MACGFTFNEQRIFSESQGTVQATSLAQKAEVHVLLLPLETRAVADRGPWAFPPHVGPEQGVLGGGHSSGWLEDGAPRTPRHQLVDLAGLRPSQGTVTIPLTRRKAVLA